MLDPLAAGKPEEPTIPPELPLSAEVPFRRNAPPLQRSEATASPAGTRIHRYLLRDAILAPYRPLDAVVARAFMVRGALLHHTDVVRAGPRSCRALAPVFALHAPRSQAERCVAAAIGAALRVGTARYDDAKAGNAVRIGRRTIARRRAFNTLACRHVARAVDPAPHRALRVGRTTCDAIVRHRANRPHHVLAVGVCQAFDARRRSRIADSGRGAVGVGRTLHASTRRRVAHGGRAVPAFGGSGAFDTRAGSHVTRHTDGTVAARIADAGGSASVRARLANVARRRAVGIGSALLAASENADLVCRSVCALRVGVALHASEGGVANLNVRYAPERSIRTRIASARLHSGAGYGSTARSAIGTGAGHRPAAAAP